jgi:hypothetical protein
MALETSTYINGLVSTNPTSSDNVGDGDNHIRLLKSVLKNTLPAVSGAITGTHTVINSAVALATAGTNANTASTLVKRDASGNFIAGTMTGNVTGNVTGNSTTATTLSTARTIALSGDATGSASFNGSANATIAVTIADDSHNHTVANVDGLSGQLSAITASIPSSAVASAAKWTSARTLSLSGDVSGSVSIDGSANRNIAVTIADDSHNHTVANVDGLQAQLNSISASVGGSAVASAARWTTARTLSLSGHVSGAVSITGANNVSLSCVVANNSHTHTIANISSLQATLNSMVASTNTKPTLLQIYPVGCIYTSVTSTNPGSLFGGSWVAFGAGRVLVGIDGSQSEFDSVNETGGAKTHTLSVSEIPAHTHTYEWENSGGSGYSPGAANGDSSLYSKTSGATGGGAAHNNLQPYIVVYMFRRTS